jgi:hypothetical protein
MLRLHEAAAPRGQRMHRIIRIRQKVQGATGQLKALPLTTRPRRILSTFGSPIPASMGCDMGLPGDATCLEQARDALLGLFMHGVVRRCSLALAILCGLALLGSTILGAVALAGIYLDIDNGWNDFDEQCVACARQLGVELTPTLIPECVGTMNAAQSHFCTTNQVVLTRCQKVYVVVYSYITFLTLPWRIANLHHLFCSPRGAAPGLDFYGRPTSAAWFHINVGTRQWIAALLNFSWLSYLASLVAHISFPTYRLSTSLAGYLSQSIPSFLSTASLMVACHIQLRAEEAVQRAERLAAALPRAPRRVDQMNAALRRWRAGEAPLWQCLREQYALYKDVRRQYEQRLLNKKADQLTGIGWLSQKFYQTTDEAVAKLQAAARGYLSRKRMKIRQRAATCIQVVWRGRSIKMSADTSLISKRTHSQVREKRKSRTNKALSLAAKANSHLSSSALLATPENPDESDTALV